MLLQREATSAAKWLSVSRFVPHSIVPRPRVNPETRGRLQGHTFGADTLKEKRKMTSKSRGRLLCTSPIVSHHSVFSIFLLFNSHEKQQVAFL